MLKQSPANIIRNRRILALWNAGAEMTAIGVALGISRNVVAGALYRARRRGEAVESRGEPANIAASRAAKQAKRKPPGAVVIHISGPRLSDDPHEIVGCRWIDGEVPGDWAYCQRRTLPMQAWCPDHRRRVYRPVATTKRVDKLVRAGIR